MLWVTWNHMDGSPLSLRKLLIFARKRHLSCADSTACWNCSRQGVSLHQPSSCFTIMSFQGGRAQQGLISPSSLARRRTEVPLKTQMTKICHQHHKSFSAGQMVLFRRVNDGIGLGCSICNELTEDRFWHDAEDRLTWAQRQFCLTGQQPLTAINLTGLSGWWITSTTVSESCSGTSPRPVLPKYYGNVCRLPLKHHFHPAGWLLKIWTWAK